MKCYNHDIDDRSVCMYCGKGLCGDCIISTPNNRYVCSDLCKDSLLKSDKAMELIHEKGERAIKVNAIIYYSMAIVFLICGIWAMVFLQDLFLTILLIPFGIAGVLAGYKTMSIYKKKKSGID